MDAAGRPFIEAVSTANISRKGVLLKDVAGKLAVGDTVGLTFGERKGKFRVIWVGQRGTAEAGHVGLQSLQVSKQMWDLKASADVVDTYVRPPQRERRLLKRLRCSVSVEVRAAGSRGQAWAWIKDLSLGGCYVGVSTPFAVESKLRIAMWLDKQTKLWADGIVISSHPGFGMGIKFVSLSRHDLETLEEFLKLLSDQKDHSASPAIAH
jgi:hypothetical protein